MIVFSLLVHGQIKMNNLRQYETDQTDNLQKLVDQMNHLHSSMGGRDSRPERLALGLCMKILCREIARSKKEWAENANIE